MGDGYVTLDVCSVWVVAMSMGDVQYVGGGHMCSVQCMGGLRI